MTMKPVYDADAGEQPSTPPVSPAVHLTSRLIREFDPAKCPQAKLTSTTVCVVCGEGIKAGDAVLPRLAVPPAEGTWRHGGCPAPEPVPDSSAR